MCIRDSTLTKEDKIIANPNCSTIQLLMALKPLHDVYKVKRIIISTYQSITGTGTKAVKQLENENNGIKGEMAYPHRIYENTLPHCDIFEDNGYTKEEMKLVKETKKIMRDDSIEVSATAVRVPVKGGHSESVNVEFYTDFEYPRYVNYYTIFLALVFKTTHMLITTLCLFMPKVKTKYLWGE